MKRYREQGLEESWAQELLSTQICSPIQKLIKSCSRIFIELNLQSHPLPQRSVVVVVQSLSHVQLFATPWTAAHQDPLSFTIFQSLLKFMSVESVMLSNHLILCCPLLFCLQSFPESGPFPINQLFASGGQSIGSLASASIPPNEYIQFLNC